MSDRLEERICSVWGVPPAVVGLAQREQKYSNMETARKIATETFLIPLFNTFAQVINNQLSEMLEEGEEFMFNYSNLPELGFQDKHRETVIQLYKNGIITRGEARQELGKEVDEERDNVFLLTGQASELINDNNEEITNNSSSI